MRSMLGKRRISATGSDFNRKTPGSHPSDSTTVARAFIIFLSLLLSPLPTAAGADDVPLTFQLAPRDLAWISVQLLDEKHLFLLDTGATVSIFDVSFRDRLGPRINQTRVGTSATAVSRFDLFAIPELVVGGDHPLRFRPDGPRPVMDVKDIQAATGVAARGILGMDFLKSHVMRLNFDAEQGEIARRSGSDSGQRLLFERGIPIIPVRVSDVGNHSFVIDTGFNAELGLEKVLFDNLIRRGTLVVREHRAFTNADATNHVRSGIVDSIELASHKFRNVAVVEVERNLIGLELMSHFHVELDFPRGVAIFRPGRRIDSPPRRDRTGFGIKRIDGVIHVCELEPDGNAERSGLKVQDVIEQINSVPVNTLSVTQIRQMQSSTSIKSMMISLKRNGMTQSIVVPLSTKPDPFPATDQ